MRFATLALASLLFAGNSPAQSLPRPSLTVNGAVEISAAPDHASFSFSITYKHAKVAEASRLTHERASLILDSLRAAGLTSANLNTSDFSVHPNWRQVDKYKTVRDGYTASVTVQVELDSLYLVEPALLIVNELQPESVSGVTFSLKDYEDLKLEALRRASRKARQKAEIMTEETKCKLGGVLTIEETTGDLGRRSWYYPNPFNASTNAAFEAEPSPGDAAGGQVFGLPGDAKISASVRVTFEILPGMNG